MTETLNHDSTNTRFDCKTFVLDIWFSAIKFIGFVLRLLSEMLFSVLQIYFRAFLLLTTIQYNGVQVLQSSFFFLSELKYTIMLIPLFCTILELKEKTHAT